MRKKLLKNPSFRILFLFCTKNCYFFRSSVLSKKYIVVDTAPFIGRKYKCQSFRASFQYSCFNVWDVFSDFFLIALKISICFFLLNRTYSETGRAELLPDMHFRLLRWKTAEWRASEGKQKKIRKSRNFRDILKISSTKVYRPNI